MLFCKQKSKREAYYYFCYTKPENKHPLEYFIFGFVVATTIATAFAAYATWGQWQTAFDQERRSLRAYVFFERAGVAFKDKMLSADFIIKNAGQTPAYELSTWFQTKIQKAGTPFVFERIQNAMTTKSMIGPGGSTIPSTTIKIPEGGEKIIAALQEGSFVYYTFGEIEFHDAFHDYWCVKFSMRSIKFENGNLLLGGTEEGNEEKKGHCDPSQ
jgi:hypothetical protein